MKHTKLFFLLILFLGLTSCTLRQSAPVPESIEIPIEKEMIRPPLASRSASVSPRPTFVLQSLPEGWTVDRHPVAKWGMSLPNVMSNVMDSAQTVEYWEEVIDVPTGFKLTLKRSKVLFQIITRLTIETVELHFVNVDHVYSPTNHEPSHYIMHGVVRTVELKPTGFPQLTADDVIKYKFLMEYGTPKEFSDDFHHYQNEQTVLKVRELDKNHVQIQMTSTLVDQKLQTAINDMYSEEGIEYQKKLLLRSIDI